MGKPIANKIMKVQVQLYTKHEIHRKNEQNFRRYKSLRKERKTYFDRKMQEFLAGNQSPRKPVKRLNKTFASSTNYKCFANRLSGNFQYFCKVNEGFPAVLLLKFVQNSFTCMLKALKSVSLCILLNANHCELQTTELNLLEKLLSFPLGFLVTRFK